MKARRRVQGPALPLALLLAALVHVPFVLWVSFSSSRPKPANPRPEPKAFLLERAPARPLPKAPPPASRPLPRPDPPPRAAPEPPIPEAQGGDSAKPPPRFSAGLLSQQIEEISSSLVRAKKAPPEGLRVVHASESSPHAAVLLAYEQGLTQKIEQVGRLNYPEAAKARHLSGRVRISIAVRRDGSLYATRILNASGEALLDQGALEIVRLAAPFAPLPEVLLATLDVLVITRTIQFDDQSRISSH